MLLIGLGWNKALAYLIQCLVKFFGSKIKKNDNLKLQTNNKGNRSA